MWIYIVCICILCIQTNFVYTQLGIRLTKTFLGARSQRKTRDALWSEFRESRARLHPVLSSASCQADKICPGSRVREDRDPARTAEINGAKAGCRRLHLRLLVKQRISREVRDEQAVSDYYICSTHWMCSLNDTTLPIRAAARRACWLASVYGRQRLEETPKPISKNCWRGICNARKDGGMDWEQRFPKCLCEAVLR